MSEGEVDDFTTVMGNLSQVNRMEDIHNVLYNFTPAQKKMYHDLVEPKLTKPEVSASLKKLDLPDEDIAKFLDWDAPLSEQSPEAAKRLRALADEIAAKDDYDIFESAAIAAYRGEHPRGARAADIKAEEFYNDLTGVFEGQVGASEALRKAGIPGLKYYDQMSRPKYSISTLEDNIFNVKDILKNLEGKPGPQAAASRRNNLRNLKLWEQELEKTKALKQTRNYVVWDQDVLNRTKILESGGETVGLLRKPIAKKIPEASGPVAGLKGLAKEVYHGDSTDELRGIFQPDTDYAREALSGAVGRDVIKDPPSLGQLNSVKSQV